MADDKRRKRDNFRKTSHLSPKKALPIDKYRKELVKAVKENDFLVVVGETGSGKTTQLAQYLYSAGVTHEGGVIGITQPRRIAAISVAHRVAQETDTEVGGLVGYQVRFDDCTSSETRIKYMTDGSLLREFLDDTLLSQYAVIILDEAHERSLDTDILFGLVKKFMVRKKQEGNNSKHKSLPKVIVMSATLNHDKFSEFLGDCPVMQIPGRVYPVQEVFCDHIGVGDLRTPNYLNKVIETVMTIHLEYPPGDVLVFLTGQEEIETCCDRLFDKAENIDYDYDVQSPELEAILILPLYGSMTTDLQRKVFDPPDPSIRKVVVATNIAATSLTIEGIRYVVDSGFVKQLSFNARTGLDSLNIVLISKSESIQRRGRAGRTAPGTCFYMYTREVFDQSMTEETIPEIQRTSLSRVVLHLKCMGINDAIRFQYIDPPEERMVLEALRQLYYFGALDSKGTVSTLGHRMVELPLAPGLSRAVLNSVELGCEDLVLPVAAMLSVENVFASGGGKSHSVKSSRIHKEIAEAGGGTNDFATLLYIYKECIESSSPAKWCREHCIHWRAVKMAVSVHQQLGRILEKQKIKYEYSLKISASDIEKNRRKPGREVLRQALCSGYFCNAARRSTSGSGFRTMDGHGTTVFIHPSSTLFGCEDQLDWIIYHDIIWTSKIYARTVCPIRYEWIKDLLPRLHEASAYVLSGWSAGDETTKERVNSSSQDDSYANDQQGDARVLAVSLCKRNTEESIDRARERYQERKRVRTGH